MDKERQKLSLDLPTEFVEVLAQRVSELLEDKGSRQRWAELAGVADYVGVSERRVRDFRERGMPAKRIGRRLLFDLREVDAWIEMQT